MRATVILILFLILGRANAQTVAALANRPRILIGEQLKLQVFAEFRKGQEISWFHIDSLPHFEIMERSRVDTIQEAGRTTLKQELTLTSWDSGKWQIPPLVVG